VNGALAGTMALAHLALIVWLVVGGPLSLRWRRLGPLHLLAVAPTAAVFLAGADCPLTVWEKHFREAAGWPSYRGGFIENYLVEPWHSGGISPLVSVAVAATWIVPTVVGHGWRIRSARHELVSSGAVSPAR